MGTLKNDLTRRVRLISGLGWLQISGLGWLQLSRIEPWSAGTLTNGVTRLVWLVSAVAAVPDCPG